jgi:hypothetical protein
MVTSITGEYVPTLLSETRAEPAYYNDGHKEELPNAVQEETVKLALSDGAKTLLTQLQGEFLPPQTNEKSSYSKNSLKKQNKKTASGTEKDGAKTAAADEELSEGEEEQVRELQKRDSEVKSHEQKHIASAGAYAKGGAVYDYQMGPDGKMYAIGGRVELDTSIPEDPDQALAKARTLRASATAVGDPSSADLSIASYANQMEADARVEKQEENEEDLEENSNTSSSPLEEYKKALQEDTKGIYVNFSA